MDTRKELFFVTFNSSEGALKLIRSESSKYDGIVIAKANQFFTINVIAKDQVEPYAAKLFIDEQEVISCKTFKKKGNFFGFKKGQGVYDRFVFSLPEFKGDYSEISEPVKEKSKMMGEIRICFFRAVNVWKKLPPGDNKQSEGSKRPNGPTEYTKVPAMDCKNVQQRSLSVGCGPSMKIPVPTSFGEKQDDKHRGMYLSTKALFDEGILDMIVLRYSSMAALIGTKLVDPLQSSHLQNFPFDFVRNNRLVLEGFYQTLTKEGKSSRQIKEILEKTFGCSVNTLLKEGFSELSRLQTERKSELTSQDFIKAVMSGQFARFCVEAPQIQPSGKDERKFLGKRSEPEKQAHYGNRRTQPHN